MRTNSLDASCYRSVIEFKRLLLVLSKLDGNKYNNKLAEYIDVTEQQDSIKQLREKHRASINWVEKRIHTFIEKNPNAKIRINETLNDYQHDVVIDKKT